MTHDDHTHDHEHSPKHFGGISPGLLVDDVQAAAEYYRDVFGFYIRFVTGEPPVFAAVNRDHAELHLMKSNPPGRRNGMQAAGEGNGADFYIGVSDIDELYEELKGRGAVLGRDPETMPHGAREFVAEDLNGYRLIFGRGLED